MIYEPFIQMVDAESAFLEALPWYDEDSVPYHLALFARYIEKHVKTRRFQSDYVEYGGIRSAQSIIMEVGAQVAYRSGAPGEDLVRWSIPEDARNAKRLWGLANDFGNAKLRAFTTITRGQTPESLNQLHELTVYQQHGVNPGDARKKDKFDRTKHKIPDELPLQIALAALHLNAGAALARSNPRLIDQRELDSELLTAVYDSMYRDGARWAQRYRADLTYLFA